MGAAATKRIRPNARGRADGKITRQDRQKQDSRDRVLDAAKAVLSRQPYALIAVEDIVAEAKMSRATFYRHFDSKFSIFLELHAPIRDNIYAIYSRLGKIKKLSIHNTAEWLKLLSYYYDSERILIQAFAQILAIEPEFGPLVSKMISEVCFQLGEYFPAFKKALSDDPKNAEIKAEAYILLEQIDYLCMANAIRHWNVNADASMRVVARNICHFIESHK